MDNLTESMQRHLSNYCETLHVDITDLINNEKSHYYPNMCHICRCYGENVDLKRCGACNMISYCSKEHQKQDWPNHKQFCRVLCQIKKDWKVDNLFQSLKVNTVEERTAVFNRLYNNGEGDILIECLKVKAAKLLKRKLNLWEMHMIQFPRICSICYESRHEILVNCKKCPQTTFCKEHLNNPLHEEECHKFIISTMIVPTSVYTTTTAVKLSAQIKTDKLPSSIIEFTKTYVTKNSVDSYSEETRDLWNISFSDEYSRPLSIIFAMEKLDFHNNSENLVIHVVGAALAELQYNDWEILLHYFKSAQKLSVILIGDEFMFPENRVEVLCETCKQENKELTIEMHSLLYDAYCGQMDFKKPDIIACLNAGLHYYPTWEKSIQVFNKGQCPLVVTAYSKNESLEDEKMVKSTFPSANCVYSGCNPFGSLIYFRQKIGLPVGCSNNFMSIYKHLG
ncbi:uncharacterized protein LOC122501422 [Leptopilina heterotoma]|uniref:uncharacterized protein LOC122501422 n=1 Tax=Leptopilina heterotoma TaxID=63436 RepID=UPI001CA9AE99|nr:uncharacterized protein LOC122501422 [Leptopilina heterotoma]